MRHGHLLLLHKHNWTTRQLSRALVCRAPSEGHWEPLTIKSASFICTYKNQRSSPKPVFWSSFSFSLCGPSGEKMASILGKVPSCQGGEATLGFSASQKRKPYYSLLSLTFLSLSHDFIQSESKLGYTDYLLRVFRL